MKNGILTIVVVLMLMFAVAGCESDFLAGLGLGAAGTAALDATETALVTEGDKLQEERTEALQGVQDANSPEELNLAEKKLQVLDNSILANKAATKTVQLIRTAAKAETPQKRSDAIVTGGVGLLLLALKQWQTRKLSKENQVIGDKYLAHKIGKAEFEGTNPVAAKKLHEAIGRQRLARGLS
jgi:hypothetical protein